MLRRRHSQRRAFAPTAPRPHGCWAVWGAPNSPTSGISLERATRLAEQCFLPAQFHSAVPLRANWSGCFGREGPSSLASPPACPASKGVVRAAIAGLPPPPTLWRLLCADPAAVVAEPPSCRTGNPDPCCTTCCGVERVGGSLHCLLGISSCPARARMELLPTTHCRPSPSAAGKNFVHSPASRSLSVAAHLQGLPQPPASCLGEPPPQPE